jgi:3-oxoacyl-[acyl-carrier-protein] synthase III
MARKTFIESLGVYLPEKRLSTDQLIEECTIRPAFDLERLTGIKERRVVDDNEFSLDLAKKAVSKCFEISSYTPRDIDMIVCGNISRVNGPNFEVSFEPSSAFKLAEYFDFGQVINFDITSACAGMFISVLLVDSYIKAGMIKRGIVVSGDYVTHATRTAQKEVKHPVDPLFASLTLGDSGAAAILDGTDDPEIGFHDIESFTVAKYCDLCTGGWVEKEYGGFVGISDSKRLMEVGADLGSDQIARKVKGTRWEKSDNHHAIFHQPAHNPILKLGNAINEKSGARTCGKENLIINVQNRGNTASTTHFVALWDFIKNGTIKSGDNVLFGVQSSGMTFGVATYTLDDLPERIMNVEQAG